MARRAHFIRKGFQLWGLLLLLSFCLPSPLTAQSAANHFAPPEDIAHQWAKHASLALAVASGALVIYNLAWRRQRMNEASTRWMLLLGVCVLPLPVLLLSGAVGIEQSKSVNFCGSCHVMGEFVENMTDPESDLLAAVHFKQRYIQHDQCYRCHSDYGFLGNIEAKKAGVGHVWKNVTGTFKEPIRMRRPYRYTICLDCHGQAQIFHEVALHENVVDKVLRGETTCLECHVASHPGRAAEEEALIEAEEAAREESNQTP